ncbi:MAG: D-alanyl-D-alanine carboxypeptidase/D-alanyl-D-alanine-endopeptidase [bacterium]
MRLLIRLLAAFLILTGSQVWPAGVERLRQDLAEVFANPDFQHATWGVHVESVDRGDVVFALNDDTLLIPASNMKLLIGAAVLDSLSPDFRFETKLFAGGPIKKGVLQGPLIVRGGGDPSIGGRFHKGDRLFAFREWAKRLKEKGIRRIEGDVIGDDNLFDDVRYGQGWQWDDLPYWYAAEISALSFNDNCVDLLIEPGRKVGSPAILVSAPPTDYVDIQNRTVTVSKLPRGKDALKEIVYRRNPNGNDVTLEGPVLQSQPRFQDWVAVPNPTLFTVSVLTDVLRREGIEVSGNPVDIDDVEAPIREESLDLLFVHSSPPLTKLLSVLLLKSQNLYAEMFLKYLGSAFGGQGSTQTGAEVVKKYLRRIGIPEDEVAIADGSGLSRENLVTPAAICALLKAVASAPYGQILQESLPVAGENGTLAGRMKKSTAQGSVWAKTGSIRGVSALSGYIRSREKELFIFSFIVNNHQTAGKSATRLQDSACRLIADFAR